MPDPSSRSPVPLWTIVVVAALVLSVAASRAVQWYGHPFPGVLITADGSVSSIGMPTWSGIEQGLRFPDRVESIDGAALVETRGEFPASAWDRAVDEAVAEGHGSVRVRVLAGGHERELDLRLTRLDAASWWLYAGTTLFMAGLYALAAFISLSSNPRGGLPRAFAKFALLSASFFVTIFDVHTTRTMVPLFHATFAWAPFALVALALRLPDDVPLVARHPWVLSALDGVGLALAGIAVVRDVLGLSVTALQSACTVLFGAAMITFVLVLGLRYARARGTRRDTLRVLFRASATPYALVGGGVLFTMLSSRGSTAAFFAIPGAGARSHRDRRRVRPARRLRQLARCCRAS